MREITCDVAVIGAGTAGLAAHRAALDAGVKSILIEQGPGGTTCARVGCMPSKLLITAANAAHEAREAHRFGVHVGHVRVDGSAVMRRVREQRDCFVASVFESVETLPEESRLTGRAVFEDSATLRIDESIRLRFKAAVIATGSSPSVPHPLDGLGERLLTTDTLFEIEDLPESIAVLGGGPVGLELAQALARLGVKTALFDPAQTLGGIADADLAGAAREIFGKDIALHLGATVEWAEEARNGFELHWSGNGGGSASFARVLAAAGRPPNVRGLGLDATGLSLDDNGMPVFDPRSLVCEGAPILIAGDANAARPVLHEASRQGGIAGRNAAALALSKTGSLDRPIPWVKLAMVFTEPQIAAIGEPGGEDGLVGRVDLCDQGRAQVMGRNQGGLRIYTDRNGRLTGAEMLGPEIEHLAHILAFAIQDGHSAQALLDRPFYHPTLEEGLQTALSDIVR